jgi:hypothetical protein
MPSSGDIEEQRCFVQEQRDNSQKSAAIIALGYRAPIDSIGCADRRLPSYFAVKIEQ